jgi:hypothetical protein
MEVIPCIAPIGYSNGLLMHDTNLAEGLPVLPQNRTLSPRELEPLAWHPWLERRHVSDE